MGEVTLVGGRLPGREGLFDIALSDGRIAAITQAQGARGSGESAALNGRLLLPALTDGHIHLDKTFLGLPWRPHVEGHTIAARTAAERSERAAVGAPLKDRARRLIERVIGLGTLAMRSHVDVDEVIGLDHVKVLLDLRAELADRIDIQLVVFPQSGLSRKVAELMSEALRMGVDVVGGLDPGGIDDDIEGHLGTVFDLADRHAARIDIHLHDSGTLGAYELRQIARRTRALGLEGRVAVSHAFALGMLDDGEFERTAEALARADVAIMTNGPGADAMPPVGRLIAAGVRVFGGSDNIRDAWSPFGDGDLLRRAGIIGYRANFRADDELRAAFDLVARSSRVVMGLPDLALEVGAPADLIALDAEDVPEAVATAPAERLVVRRGRVVTA